MEFVLCPYKAALLKLQASSHHTMAAATALQPLLNSISSPLVQLLLLSVPVSFAVFVLAVLSHADGRAYGASRARPDLEVVPGAWPLLGNLLQVAKTGDRQLEGEWSRSTPQREADSFTEWVRMRRAQKDQSKNLTVSIPFIRIIDCTSPQAIEYIQKTNFSNYVKGPLFGDVMNDILGEGEANPYRAFSQVLTLASHVPRNLCSRR